MAFNFGRKGVQQPQMPASQMPSVAGGPPTEEVMRLRQQGLSNAQIAENLQRSGFKTHQIFDAMNQADIGMTGEPIQGAPYFDQSPQQPQQPASDYADYVNVRSDDERVEEIAEAIIDEKWNELLKDISKIAEWKVSMEANMKALEARQGDLKQSFDSLHKALVAKLNDYDQNITGVNTELKALEKVFQKILPAFTENVNELSRVVKDIKKAK